MSELLSNQAARVEELHQMNGAMRSHLAVHHQLISDVRSVLKIMAKVFLNDAIVRKMSFIFCAFST